MSDVLPEEGGGTPFSLRSLGSPTALLTFAGLMGQAFAIVRTVFIASEIGTSPALDALLVAQAVPVVVSGLLVTGVRTALVPAYIELQTERGERHASRFVGAIVTWTALLGLVAVALLVLFPATAVAAAGPGLSSEAHAEALHFQPLLAPILLVSAVAGLMTTLCQANKRFLPIAVSLATAPMVSLVVTIVFWKQLGLDGLAIGLTLGYVASLVATISYTAKVGLLPPIVFALDLDELGRFLRHAFPLTVGSAVLQVNLLTDRAVASILSPGAVSALNYGQQIVLQPLGSLSMAWTIVLYPALVSSANSAAGSLGEGASRAIRYTLVLFLPLAAAVMALSPLIVEVAYQRGAFDAHSAALTAGVVAAFAPMLLFTMIQPVLTGAHNSRRRGVLLGTTAIANAILNVLLNVVFGVTLGVAGVALSTSVTVAILMAWLAARLSQSEEGFSLFPLLTLGSRSLAAAVIAALPLSIVVWVFLPALPLILAAAVLAGMLLADILVYMVVGRLLGVGELAGIVGGVRRGAAALWSRG